MFCSPPLCNFVLNSSACLNSSRIFFVRISKLELGTNAKVKVLTGHTQDSTIDTYYDKHDIEEQKESAKKVSKVYSFIKK